MPQTQFLKLEKPATRVDNMELFVGQKLDEFDSVEGGSVDVDLTGATGNRTLTATEGRHREIQFIGTVSGLTDVRLSSANGTTGFRIFRNTTGSAVLLKSAGANVGNSSGVSVANNAVVGVSHDGESVYQIGGATISTEDVQDIVGAMLADSSELDITYDDPGGSANVQLKTTTVTPGAYTLLSATFDSKGRATAAASGGFAAVSAALNSNTHRQTHFRHLCAAWEPMALEKMQKDAFTYAVASGALLMNVAGWRNTRNGVTGRWEKRNPGVRPHLLRGPTTIYGIGTGSTGIFLDPSLPTYANPEETYYTREARLSELVERVIPLTAENQTQRLLLGAHGGMATKVDGFDLSWVTLGLGPDHAVNLWNEKGDVDADSLRFDNELRLPLSKWICDRVRSGEGLAAGADPVSGSLTFVDFPSDWPAYDPDLAEAGKSAYLAREDCMANLSVPANWSRTQTGPGQVERDTFWNWVKGVGSGSWSSNYIQGVTALPRSGSITYLVDIYVPQSNEYCLFIVGLTNGAGGVYADHAHALVFEVDNFIAGTGNISAHELGTSKGAVGSGFVTETMYRVMIQPQTGGGAVYKIQGGAYGQLRSATWTTLTPPSGTSGTTANMRMGFNIYAGPMWWNDMKVY